MPRAAQFQRGRGNLGLHGPRPPRSTLRFACRAKRVVNNATVNEVLSDAAVLKRQAKEIEELRRMLEGTG